MDRVGGTKVLAGFLDAAEFLQVVALVLERLGLKYRVPSCTGTPRPRARSQPAVYFEGSFEVDRGVLVQLLPGLGDGDRVEQRALAVLVRELRSPQLTTPRRNTNRIAVFSIAPETASHVVAF